MAADEESALGVAYREGGVSKSEENQNNGENNNGVGNESATKIY